MPIIFNHNNARASPALLLNSLQSPDCSIIIGTMILLCGIVLISILEFLLEMPRGGAPIIEVLGLTVIAIGTLQVLRGVAHKIKDRCHRHGALDTRWDATAFSNDRNFFGCEENHLYTQATYPDILTNNCIPTDEPPPPYSEVYTTRVNETVQGETEVSDTERSSSTLPPPSDHQPDGTPPPSYREVIVDS